MKFLTLIAISLSTFGFAQVAVLNELEGEPLLQNRKLELGIKPNSEVLKRVNSFVYKQEENSDPLNPYLEWELDLETVFTHTESGLKKKRDGFFFLNYERDERKNDWKLKKDNPYPFRVRFSPSKPGEWSAKTILRYRLPNGKDTLVEFETLKFQVQPSSRQGYVKVHQNKRNLERGGKVIYPIGQTFPGPYNRTKIWSSHKDSTNKAADVVAWKNFLMDVESYAKRGGRFIKTIETAYGNLIEFEHLGDYTNRLHYAWETDRLMEICEEYDVLVNFNFLYQTVIYTYDANGEKWPWGKGGFVPDRWDYGIYGPDENVNPADEFPPYAYYVEGKRPSHMFTDERMLSFHKQRTRYYIARWGYSPQILAYELLSEPWWLNGITSKGYYPALGDNGKASEEAISALDNYHRVMSDFIKDSLDCKESLIMINQFMIEGSWPEKSFVKAAAHHNIDLIGGSNYSSRPDKFLIQKDGANNRIGENEQSHYKELVRLQEVYDKPVFFSEAGHYPSIGSVKCVGDKMHRSDVMTIPFTGSAGSIMWTGYRRDEGGHYKSAHGKPDERLVWQATIDAQKFLDNGVFSIALNGNWVHGAQSEKTKGSARSEIKEMQYFISESKEKAVGYIKNRSYNYYTQRDLSKCADAEGHVPEEPFNEFSSFNLRDGRKLHVSGLQGKKRYTMKIYNTKGSEVQELELKTKRSGKLKLKIDVQLDDKLPILWFELVQIN